LIAVAQSLRTCLRREGQAGLSHLLDALHESIEKLSARSEGARAVGARLAVLQQAVAQIAERAIVAWSSEESVIS
jgi:hypothetical protein